VTGVPGILTGHQILFEGVDDTTPAGCTIVTAMVLGTMSTYIIRDGAVIGRIEHVGQQAGYVGTALKGGNWIGSGDSTELGEKIASYPLVTR
jgi:hypothetical protein